MELLYTDLQAIWQVPEFTGTPTRPKFEFSGIPLDYDQATHFIRAAYRPVLAGEITGNGKPLLRSLKSKPFLPTAVRCGY